MIEFKLMPVISDAEIDKIEDAGFRVLEEVGVQIPCDGVLNSLSGRAGIHVDGGIVRFDREVVKDVLKSAQGCKQYDTHIMAGAYSHNYLDPDTDQIRPSTLDDLLKSIKISDAMGVGVIAPVVPLDVPGPMQELVMERLTHEYARCSFGAGQATHIATAEAGLRMSELIGRPHGLELWVDSPLSLNAKGLDIIWKLRHLKPGVKVSGMPVIGMSVPMSVGGTFAVSVAECFGSITALKLAAPECTVEYRIDAFVPYSVDMRTGNVLLNGPDYLKLLTISNAIGRRNGITVPCGKALLTSSKLPDAQAGAEKAGQCMAMALVGSDCFVAAGVLSVIETFSPVQLAIDIEIMDVVDTYVRPMDPIGDFDMDVIKEVGHGNLFMAEESTVANMRDYFWRPNLFSINPLYTWKAEGSQTIEQKAKDMVSSLKLSEEPVVSADVQRELQSIEDYFAAKL